jgi:DNA-3-methyladenine glycosylase
MKLLCDNYYQKKDVLSIAKDLLGKIIVTNINNQITSGEIVETEAYNGIIDKACHAYNNRKTKRTAVMYEKGGISYVYLCYGMHYLFNIVTGKKDTPHAVLIRAIRPIDGISLMLKRRKKAKLTRSLTAGPGSLSEALGIDKSFNTIKLTSEKIQIYNAFTSYLENDIIISKRVNVAYAKEDALLPYRFRVKNSSWTSLAK